MAEVSVREIPDDDTSVSEDEVRAEAADRLLLVLLFAVVFALAVRPALDHDLWWHLRTGQWMVEHHRWVGVDPFQHTVAGVARVQTDWLSDLTFYGLWRLGGLPALSVLVASLATLGTYLVFRTTSGRFGVRVAVTGCVAAASSIHWVIRPQMFTFVLTAAIVLLVRRWRAAALDTGDGPAWIWWLVPLVALGANLHGGVVYGVLILLAMVVGEWVDVALARFALPPFEIAPRLSSPARRGLTAVGLGAVVAMAVNPSGARIYLLPFHQVSSAAQFVDEVRPPDPTDSWIWPFVALLAAGVLLLARSWRRIDGVNLLPILGTAALSVQFVRSIPFFAIAVAPFVAAQGSAWWAERRPTAAPMALTAGDHHRLRQAVALVVGAVLVTTPFRIAGPRIDEAKAEMFPVAAVEWLNDHRPPGDLYNDFDWGGYLILHAPEYRVSIDGRTDVYDDYLDTAITTMLGGPGWEAQLDREEIGTVLVPRGVGLGAAIEGDPDWRTAYQDSVASIYVRR